MTDSVPEVISEPPSNRLAISHLMLWTLGSGVVLAFHRLQEVPMLGMPPGMQIPSRTRLIVDEQSVIHRTQYRVPSTWHMTRLYHYSA